MIINYKVKNISTACLASIGLSCYFPEQVWWQLFHVLGKEAMEETSWQSVVFGDSGRQWHIPRFCCGLGLVNYPRVQALA